MNRDSRINPLVTLLFILGSLSITLLALRAAKEILSPVILAFILAITASPIINWLKKKGVPGTLAFLLTIVLIFVLVLGLVWLISASIQDFRDRLPAYSQNLAELEQNANQLLGNIGLNIESLAASERIVTPEAAMGLAASFAGDLISRLSNWTLILVTSIFFLLETTKMPEKIKRVVEDSDPDVHRFLSFNQDIRQFMSITASGGLLAAVLEVILLLFLGVEFALLWGVFAFFMSFVPQIGIILALIPPAIMALIQFGVTEMLIVIAGFIIINQLVENFVKRPILQKRLNLSVLVIFISLILWGWVLGPIGAILSVPMALIVKTILDSREETRWMAYLMGDGQEPFNPAVEDDQNSSPEKAT